MAETNSSLLEKVQTNMVSEFSKTLEMFDLSPSEARLFVTLYINKEPMTLDEMSQALGKSKTSMSTGIRSLLEANLVERVWKKGVRKDLYRAKENLYRKIMSTYIDKWLDAAERQKQSLRDIAHQLKNTSVNEENDLEALRERVHDMIEFHRLIEENFKEINPKEK
jgi:HTH-type transcriptional regulator, osmoprotectant uptake regulator